MKKPLLVLLVLAVTGASAFAVDLLSFPPSVRPGNVFINAGVGFATAPLTGASMVIPPLVASIDVALPIEVPISVGGLVGFYRWEWMHITPPHFDTLTFITFGGRANWHWNIDIEWLNLYTGIFLGWTHFTWESTHPTIFPPSFGGLEFGGQVGARFFFARNMGAVVELGFPFVAMAGLTFRF